MTDNINKQPGEDQLIPGQSPLGPTRANKPKQPKKKRRIFLKIFLVLLFLGCVGFLAVAGIVYSIAKDAPKLETVKLEDPLSSRIFDINEKIISELGEKKRETVAIDEVPLLLKQAIISIEDKRFEDHIGVDPIRIMGAAVSNLKGNDMQGGSTLTQQLIKLSFFSTDVKDQNYKRKIQEAWMSIQLERQKSKDEVLNYYINKVYMANRFYGMETASKGYYNKPLNELTLAQTALLAGIPQAPSDYDPILAPEAAKKRRDTVLKEMLKDEVISDADYNTAVAEPIDHQLIKTQEMSKDAKIIDNYIKQVIAEVQEKTTRDIYSDGLDIYTNLDLDAQKYIYHVVNSDEYINYTDYPAEAEGEVDQNFQAAITIMDPKNGQVKAQLGGRKVPDDVQLGENLAVSAKRDFGSTVKPITDYAPAIEYLNYSTARNVLDSPYSYPGSNPPIPVLNYDRLYRGNLTIREALIDSRNVPAVRTLDEVGLDKAKTFLSGLGINHKDGPFYSSAISGDYSSLQMAGAYSALANGGIYYKPYYVNKIVMPDGQEEVFKPEGKRAMKESTAYMVTDMLKDVLNRGTGMNALVPGLTQAGKTGTSNYTDEAMAKLKRNVYGGVPDISFVGYTTNYVVSIWTGYGDYFYPIASEDQQTAMLMYKYIMGYLSQNIDTPDWEIPEDVVKIGTELYVKDHTTDQNTWTVPSSTWEEYTVESSSVVAPPPSSSTIQSSITPPPTSSTVQPPVDPEPEPSVPPTSSSNVEPPTSSNGEGGN